ALQLRDAPAIEPPLTLRQEILTATSHRPVRKPAFGIRHILSPRIVTYSGLLAAGAAAALLLFMPRATVVVSKQPQFATTAPAPSIPQPQLPANGAPNPDLLSPEQPEQQIEPGVPQPPHSRETALAAFNVGAEARKDGQMSRPISSGKLPAPRHF